MAYGRAPGDGVYPPLDIWQTADGRWQGAYSVRNEPSVVSRRIWLGNCAESSLRTKVCVPAGTSAAISVLPPTALPSSQAFGLFTPSKRSLIGSALAVWKRVAARKTSPRLVAESSVSKSDFKSAPRRVVKTGSHWFALKSFMSGGGAAAALMRQTRATLVLAAS